MFGCRIALSAVKIRRGNRAGKSLIRRLLIGNRLILVVLCPRVGFANIRMCCFL